MQVTRRRRALLVAASALHAAGVWWMTLRPTIYDENVGGILHAILRAARGWPPTAWITFDGVEFTANVVMFAPLGVLVLLWGGRWWHGIAAGLLISSAIETTQLLFLPTRVADVRDVIANTSGAAIGVVLMAVVGWRAARSQDSHKPRHRKLIDTSAQ
ncbi:VanZ family protein [Microbacterium sp. NPDC086615]|uniref:VanZ family protein n=1 Tax=Microbacterium sp. NPDC086615 TaxID=3154865 RepID=UPI003430325B